LVGTFISELQDKSSSKGRADLVAELAKVVAVDVGLHVARIEAIKSIENFETDLRMALLNRKPNLPMKLNVGRNEPGGIARGFELRRTLAIG
jgi:hypothetical protein